MTIGPTPAANAPLYCTVFSRNPEFSAIAQAEMRALGGGEVVEPGIMLSDVPILADETGFGTLCGRQLAAATTLETLGAQVRSLALVAPTVGIDVRRIPRGTKGTVAAKRVVADSIDADVDYRDPALRLLLIVTPAGYRVLSVLPGGDATWLGATHKAEDVSVAISAPLARAMLHLTARPGESVFDPCCGSGTIPIVAAFGGHTASGSDLSFKTVHQARANAAALGQRPALTQADARTTDQRADCVITNLPYDLCCELDDQALNDILANIKRLAPKVTIVTSMQLEGALAHHGYDLQRTIRVEPARFERFIYVTRT